MSSPGLFEQVVDLFYPAYCVGCGCGSAGVLCPGCFRATERSGPVEEESTGGAFQSLKAAGYYRGLLRDMVLQLKSGKRAYARPLGELMASATGNSPPYVHPAAVFCVPSTRAKVARRGFNPAELLARQVAERIGAPPGYGLYKTRRTPDQDRTPGHLRAGNVEGAFAVTGGAKVRGDVLLVDDVLTTGATCAACSLALLQAGADSVRVLVAARAPLH